MSLGIMIQKMLLSTCGLVPISDKESYAYIRLKTPAEMLVKMFRKGLNKALRVPITDAVKWVVKENPGFKNFDLKSVLGNFKS